MLKSRACAFTVPTPFRLVYVFVVVGSIGRFSVGVNEGVPQPPLESLEIRVGMTVKRGKDWQYGNQDGQGNDEKLALGTVIEVRKWKKAADVNLEGNKADEKADENVVKKMLKKAV